MKRLLLTLPILLLLCASAHGQSCPAASTTAAAVQAAITNCSGGGTVTIPPGTSGWAGDVTASPTGPLTIQGATTCTGTPTSACTDNTNITINNPGRFI